MLINLYIDEYFSDVRYRLHIANTYCNVGRLVYADDYYLVISVNNYTTATNVRFCSECRK